jgi:hypothetical protein
MGECLVTFMATLLLDGGTRSEKQIGSSTRVTQMTQRWSGACFIRRRRRPIQERLRPLIYLPASFDSICGRHSRAHVSNPLCMTVLLELQYASPSEVLLMLRDSEKSGNVGSVPLFLTCVRFSLLLFTVSHTIKYVQICCELLTLYLHKDVGESQTNLDRARYGMDDGRSTLLLVKAEAPKSGEHYAY